MFNPAMLDPEMMRLAQEQIRRMKPEDLQRIQQQMMSNPEMLRQAANMRPDEVKLVAEQMKHLSPQQLDEFSNRMKTIKPEELMPTDPDYQAALSLKNQGNQLHNASKYREASEKYLMAKENIVSKKVKQAEDLSRTCSLNLMSCYLKTKQYDQTVAEGTEVLASQPNNLKAVYRRGQAYKELGRWQLALADLRKAHKIDPSDATVESTLKSFVAELESQGIDTSAEQKDGSVEDIDGEEENEEVRVDGQGENGTGPASKASTASASSSSPSAYERPSSSATASVAGASSFGGFGDVGPDSESLTEAVTAFKQNPEMFRNMQSMMSSMDPATMAAMSGGRVTPEMASLAANMMKNMKPEQMESLVNFASTVKGNGGGGPRGPTMPLSREGSGSGAASASRVGGLGSGSSGAATSSSSSGSGVTREEVRGSRGRSGLEEEDSRGEEVEEVLGGRSNVEVRGAPAMGADMFGGLGMPPPGDPGMMEAMREQLRNPEAMKAMSEMMKSMDPETFAQLSSQMGMNMNVDEAKKAQEMLDSVMVWATRANKVADSFTKLRKKLFGNPLFWVSLVILVIAIVLHYLGIIGS